MNVVQGYEADQQPLVEPWGLEEIQVTEELAKWELLFAA